jgi:hypothetical protein
MKIDKIIDEYITEATHKKGKEVYKSAVNDLTDWADDMFEVVEAEGDMSDVRTMDRAIENLNKALQSVDVRINMIDKIMKRFK